MACPALLHNPKGHTTYHGMLGQGPTYEAWGLQGLVGWALAQHAAAFVGWALAQRWIHQ